MIKKYKRKSYFVEAVQWTGENKEEIEAFIGKECNVNSNGVLISKDINGYYVRLYPEHYVIKENDGEFVVLDSKNMTKVFNSAQNETQREYCNLLIDRIDQMSDKTVSPANYDFGTAIKFLKVGGAIRRAGWNGKGLFVVKQVPSHITADIIPNMQSLPQTAKDIIMARKEPHIDYTNQMLIINPDGRADSWVPSSSDVFAEDWELVTE